MILEGGISAAVGEAGRSMSIKEEPLMSTSRRKWSAG